MFVRYLSNVFIASMNIRMTLEQDGWYAVQVVSKTGKPLSEKRFFKTSATAQEWYDNTPGTGAGRLLNAINRLGER